MKKILMFFFFVLLFFPLISAVEFNINENYSKGETIIARASGNFLTPLTKENVLFYKEHVKIPMSYDITKIDNDYYIYAVLSGKAEGNYSISLENVRYMAGSEVSQDNIARNFSITNQTASFSVNPGFIVTAIDFSISVQNLLDKEIMLAVNTAANTTVINARRIFISSSESVTETASFLLKSGEIKEISLVLGNGQPVFKKIEMTSGNLTYEIPVYVFQASAEPVKNSFRLEPSELIVSSSTNSDTKRTVYLYNSGAEEIKNITLSFSDSIKPFVNLTNYKIDKLAANSNMPIDLHFFSPGDIEISGHFKAETPQLGTIAYLQLTAKFLNNYVAPLINTSKDYTAKTCAELQGTICVSATQKCSVNITEAKDSSSCCVGGTCSERETSSSSLMTVIGISILIAIIVALVWFYKKKYKGAKKPVDLLKIAGRK